MEFSWHNASKICDMSVPDMLLQDKSRYFSFTNWVRITLKLTTADFPNIDTLDRTSVVNDSSFEGH